MQGKYVSDCFLGSSDQLNSTHFYYLCAPWVWCFVNLVVVLSYALNVSIFCSQRECHQEIFMHGCDSDDAAPPIGRRMHRSVSQKVILCIRGFPLTVHIPKNQSIFGARVEVNYIWGISRKKGCLVNRPMWITCISAHRNAWHSTRTLQELYHSFSNSNTSNKVRFKFCSIFNKATCRSLMIREETMEWVVFSVYKLLDYWHIDTSMSVCSNSKNAALFAKSTVRKTRKTRQT